MALSLWIEDRLSKAEPAELIVLESELHQWARNRFAQIAQKEGAPYDSEGAPLASEGAPFLIKTYQPYRLIKLAHSHPLWARMEKEYLRRFDLFPPFTLEEEAQIMLGIRDRHKEKGWILD